MNPKSSNKRKLSDSVYYFKLQKNDSSEYPELSDTQEIYSHPDMAVIELHFLILQKYLDILGPIHLLHMRTFVFDGGKLKELLAKEIIGNYGRKESEPLIIRLPETDTQKSSEFELVVHVIFNDEDPFDENVKPEIHRFTYKNDFLVRHVRADIFAKLRGTYVRTAESMKLCVKNVATGTLADIPGESHIKKYAPNIYVVIPRSGALPHYVVDSAHGAVRQSFGMEYCDPEDYVGQFVEKFVFHVAKSWEQLKYYSPYCTLVQGSGTGKTRFLIQVGQRSFMFYICLRPEGRQYGFPYRSTCASRVLDLRTEDEVWTFLTKCMAYLNHFIEKNGSYSFGQFLNPQLVDNSEHSMIGEQFWSEVEAMSPATELTFLKNIPVCFAFDEARVLLKPLPGNTDIALFRIIRGAFRRKRLDCLMTAIFTDTQSKLRNFNPPKKVDPSFRDLSEFDQDLPPPYWTLPGWHGPLQSERYDMLQLGRFAATSYETISPTEGSKSGAQLMVDTPVTMKSAFKNLPMPAAPITPFSETQEVVDFAHWIYSFGRPLWRGFLENHTDRKQAIIQCRDIAITKLVCQLESEKQPLSMIQILAVLEARLCLKLSASTTTSADLVAQYMAVAYFISHHRDYVMIGFPVEPIISAAAQHWTMKTTMNSLLDALMEGNTAGIVRRGYRGELVTKILLTRGFDTALNGIDLPVGFLCPDLICISLRVYLTSTFGPQSIDALMESCALQEDPELSFIRFGLLEKLLNGQVRINKWIKLDDDVEDADPRAMFFFGLAASTCENAIGLDKIIPVRFEDGTFSWILVQDKNNEKTDALEGSVSNVCSWTRCVSGQAPTSPYLILYIQVGDAKKGKVNGEGIKNLFVRRAETRSGGADFENHHQFALGVYGLSENNYPFLREEINGGLNSSLILKKLRLLRDGFMETCEKGPYGDKCPSALNQFPFPSERLHDLRLL